MADRRAQKGKKGNKHATNARRRERKARKSLNKGQPGGKCGSSFCSPQTGCEPWKRT